MYGARHAMLHARAMPCGGEGISERGCQKTPDFGLVEGSRSPFQTCRTTQSQRARAHAATCHLTDVSVPFLRNGARWKRRRSGGLGELTGDRLDRCPGNCSWMARRPHWSLPVADMWFAQRFGKRPNLACGSKSTHAQRTHRWATVAHKPPPATVSNRHFSI